MRVAVELVRDGAANACVSAGNTGAAVLACTRHFPLLPGVRSTGLASVYPRQIDYPGQDYLAMLVDDERVADGQAKLKEWDAALAQAEAAVAGANAVIAAAQGGAGIVAVASLANRPYLRLWVHPEVNRVEELRGKVQVRAMGCEPRLTREMVDFVRCAERAKVDAAQIFSLEIGHGAKPTVAEMDKYNSFHT